MKVTILLLLGYIISGGFAGEKLIDTAAEYPQTRFDRCVEAYQDSDMIELCDIYK